MQVNFTWALHRTESAAGKMPLFRTSSSSFSRGEPIPKTGIVSNDSTNRIDLLSYLERTISHNCDSFES